MVQHTAAHIHLSCQKMMGIFLVHYPLGQKRMQEHLSFFINNLNYIHETGWESCPKDLLLLLLLLLTLGASASALGRESTMEMLHLLFNKMPETMLDKKAAYFFIPLMLRLVNNKSSRL